MITSLGFLGETLMYGNDELSATLNLPAKTIVFRLNTDERDEQNLRNSGWADASEIIKLDPYTFQITYPYSDWSSRFNAQSGELVEVIAFNAEGITNLHLCFGQSHNLTKVGILINTDSVTDMSYMFQDCDGLTKIPWFNTSNVTNMEGMFYNMPYLENIPWLDTHNVTNMKKMFMLNASLNNLPSLVLPHFDMSNVVTCQEMFKGNDRPMNMPLWMVLPKLENVSQMFEYTHYANPYQINSMYNKLRNLATLLYCEDCFRGTGSSINNYIWQQLPSVWGGNS